MKRPLVFALELLAALALATAGAWLADKVGRKINAKSNADVRASYAQERIAAALERAYPDKPAKPRRPSESANPELCSEFVTQLGKSACVYGAAAEFLRLTARRDR